MGRLDHSSRAVGRIGSLYLVYLPFSISIWATIYQEILNRRPLIRIDAIFSQQRRRFQGIQRYTEGDPIAQKRFLSKKGT